MDGILGSRIQDEGGVEFSVWAPHAEKVWVVGDFNEWEAEKNPLEPSDEGFWKGLVPEAATGAEYKFVIKNNGSTLWKNDPVARQVTNSAGNSVVYDDDTFDWGDDAQFEMRPWNELVIYEMHLGTFHRGENKDTAGTFDDAIERFDHLVDLGVNAIELMPVAEFAGGQSWGYNPAYPCAVESDYGGPDALKRFVKAAHERGLAVIMDVVYNHFGPSDLDMWQFDGWSENGGGGIYFYNDWKARTPWGDTRPDYGRGEVREYIRNNALMWLDAYHCDGLRFDMTFYIRSVDDGAEIPEGWSLAQWINRDIAEKHPHALTIAEDLRSNDWITRPPEEGGAGFGSQWDEQFVHPVRAVLSAQEDEHRSMEAIAKAVSYSYNGEAFQRVVYTESHDEVANGKSRVPTEVDEFDGKGFWARKRSALGACLAMTSPGIPMIFQGQELLATGYFEDGNELDWEGGKWNPGMVRIYRDLIRLRTNRDGVTGSLQSAALDLIHVHDGDKIVAYARGEGDDRVMVVLNFSQQTWEGYRIGFPEGGKWNLIFHADAKVYSEDFGGTDQLDVYTEEIDCDGRPHSAACMIGSYDCLIWKYCP